MPPVGFEPIISAGERPQTYALDRAATGTGVCHDLDELLRSLPMYQNFTNIHSTELCFFLSFFFHVGTCVKERLWYRPIVPWNKKNDFSRDSLYVMMINIL